MCIILCARLDWPRSSDTYVNMSVWKYVCARRLEKQMNITVLLAVWYERWWDKVWVLRRVEMYIDLKSRIILIWIPSVILVFLYFYFRD